MWKYDIALIVIIYLLWKLVGINMSMTKNNQNNERKLNNDGQNNTHGK